jgi:hypothetical protein
MSKIKSLLDKEKSFLNAPDRNKKWERDRNEKEERERDRKKHTHRQTEIEERMGKKEIVRKSERETHTQTNKKKERERERKKKRERENPGSSKEGKALNTSLMR